MNLTPLFKRLGKVASDNSPAILTSIGVTGTLAAVYLAAKGAFEASDILREAAESKEQEFLGDALKEVSEGEEAEGIQTVSPEPLTLQEKFELTWQCYLPAAGCVVLSVTAVICSNRISDRRAAAMASAYSVVRESYSEYRAKNVEKIGKKKEQEVRDEIAQDRRDLHPIEKSTLVITGKGPTLCRDAWSGRDFTSSKNVIDAAVNKFNQDVINQTYGSLSDFYDLIGLAPTTNSNYVGWNTDSLLEIDFSGTLDTEGEPCLQIEFKTPPLDRFDRSF